MYLFVFVHSKNLILVISQTKALHHKGLLFPWSRYHIGVVHMHIRVKVLLVCCLRGIHLLCQSRKYWSHSLGNAVKLLFKGGESCRPNEEGNLGQLGNRMELQQNTIA